MTDRTDFFGLYRELGVEAGCTLEALRLAYRRRVAELHPDRAAGGIASEEQLKALNLRYDAVLEFHRVHGRLPGEASEPVPRPVRASAGPRQSAVEAPTLPQEEPPAGPRRGVVLWLVVLALVVLWWWSASPDAGVPAVAAEDAFAAGAAIEGDAGALRFGASPASVVALHGEPVGREQDGRHWLYGPSWVDFHCDRVVDWYSSPLQPLKVAAERPSAAERDDALRLRRRPCPVAFAPGAGR